MQYNFDSAARLLFNFMKMELTKEQNTKEHSKALMIAHAGYVDFKPFDLFNEFIKEFPEKPGEWAGFGELNKRIPRRYPCWICR